VLKAAIVSIFVSAGMFFALHFLVVPRLPVHHEEVPPLTGLSPEQARGLLEPRGLLLVLEGERQDGKAAPGTIVEHHPLGGSRLKRGEQVHATLARAAPQPMVPAIIGLTLQAARDALTKAGYTPGRVSESPSEGITKGMVVTSVPPPGGEARIGSMVDLVVSSGPSVAAVPQVVGKRLTQAKTLLEQAGFAVGTTKYGSNDDYDQGVIIAQKPPSGAAVPPGTKIDLTIND
jgi:serine/threonine-protein kinase